MPVNSNTLIHFTGSMENLIEILKSDFHPRLCLEDFSFVLNEKESNKIALPMVCFCDIPLHLVKEHMAEYGNYGIGLKKSWGLRYGLCPVHYITNNSYVHGNMSAIYNKISTLDLDASTLLSPIWNHLAFTKPHHGISHKNQMPKVFYDEREWRFFPNIFSLAEMEDPALTEEDFNDLEKREKANQTLKSISLPYTPRDIKYIIVSEESEIPDLIFQIDRVKSLKYHPDEIALLKTKIICAEYMLEDF